MKNQKRKSSILSIAAVVLCSGVIALTACKKDEVQTPSPAVKSETPVVSKSSLSMEKQNQLDEMISALPVGSKLLEVANAEVEERLNVLFSTIHEDPNDFKEYTFTQRIDLTDGKVNLLEETAWLAEAALNVTETVVNDPARYIMSIDVVPTLVEETVAEVTTTITTSALRLLDPILGICNQRPNDMPYTVGAPWLQSRYNICDFELPGLFTNVISIENEYIEYRSNISNYYYSSRYLYYDDNYFGDNLKILTPTKLNDAHYVAFPNNPRESYWGLTGERWFDYYNGLKYVISDKLSRMPTPNGSYYIAVVTAVENNYTNPGEPTTYFNELRIQYLLVR